MKKIPTQYELIFFAKRRLIESGILTVKVDGKEVRVIFLDSKPLTKLYRDIFKTNPIMDFRNKPPGPSKRTDVWREELRLRRGIPKPKKERPSRSAKEPKFSKSYQDHLDSDKWKEFRLNILEKYNNTCQKCGSKFDARDLHVHHLHYRSFGNEKDEDVLLVCVKCHEEIHGRVFTDRNYRVG